MFEDTDAKHYVRIAFDLDDTLIPCLHEFETEPRPLWARLFAREQLRLGTVGLLRQIIASGHDVWVYTKSLRSSFAVRLLFLAYGVRIGGCINAHYHQRVVRRSARPWARSSKYPPAFGIDVLIDDLEGVEMEGGTHGFRVIIVRPDDSSWTQTVRRKLGLT